MTQMITKNWPACVVGIFLLGLIFHFLSCFLLRGVTVGRQLRLAIRQLENIREDAGGIVTNLQTIGRHAMTSTILGQLWQQYIKTLHAQREPDENGQSRIVRWRATALAEVFFTEHVLVDLPLNSEYVRHIPGILTGLGIIGTFSGLIQGLLHFHFSIDSGTASELALDGLLQTVAHAFYVSATAISLAMLSTFLERQMVGNLYRKVERLQRNINRLFVGGAPEEDYLQRIVAASETNATQAVQLKDALVTDLKKILSELTEKQIETTGRQTEQFGQNLRNTLQAVESERAARDQPANERLMDVLTAFTADMRDTLGGQVAVTRQVAQTSDSALQAIAGKLEQLITHMDHVGDNAADTMTERVAHTVCAMEERQQAATEKMQAALAGLAEQVGTLAERPQGQMHAAGLLHKEQAGRALEENREAIAAISSQVMELTGQVAKSTQALQKSVEALSSASSSSIEKMNRGADKLCVASEDLARAGGRVAESLRLASGTVESMRAAADALVGASNTTKQIAADYGRTRDVFAVMVSELRSMVEDAKLEAGITEQALAQLRSGATQLSVAEKQASEYLAEISRVLGKSHQEFAANIERTLRTANGEFHKQLAEAVGHLSGGIQDLAEILEQIPVQR